MRARTHTHSHTMYLHSKKKKIHCTADRARVFFLEKWAQTLYTAGSRLACSPPVLPSMLPLHPFSIRRRIETGKQITQRGILVSPPYSFLSPFPFSSYYSRSAMEWRTSYRPVASISFSSHRRPFSFPRLATFSRAAEPGHHSHWAAAGGRD